MDYRELLKKYITLIIENEGIDYIDRINDGCDNIVFTEEEKTELEKIAEEIK